MTPPPGHVADAEPRRLAEDADRVRNWKDDMIAKLTGGLGSKVKKLKLNHLRGLARFADSHTIIVTHGDCTVLSCPGLITNGDRLCTCCTRAVTDCDRSFLI